MNDQSKSKSQVYALLFGTQVVSDDDGKPK